MSFPQSLLMLADDVTTTAGGAAPPAPPAGPNGWLLLGLFLCVVILPFALGNLLSKLLKVKDMSLKIGITLFALTLSVSPFISALVNGQPLSECFRMGIDLDGGTNMVFQIDMEAAVRQEKVAEGGTVSQEAMTQLVGAIRRRLNVSGVEEIVVRQVGDDRVEVIIPGTDDPEYVDQIINRITELGSLEISLVANRVDFDRICTLGMEAAAAGQKDVRDGGRLVAQWLPVGAEADGQPKEIGAPSGSLSQDFEYRGVPDWNHYLVVVEQDPSRRISGRLLNRASESMDDNGLPAVGFQFNFEGADLFYEMTSVYQPREASGHRTSLAVVLSGEVHSAPAIDVPISGGSGIIHGSFTPKEVRELVDVLNAGALEIPLVQEPIQRYEISPMLGADVREKGVTAIFWSAVAVFVFMLVYYLFSGVVANICLAFNVLLIMGVMALIDATFTLPGLAGLVLTIGMAVDANVLIFERIREESAKGSSIRMSIQNGFGKAFSTIIDANITTLITAVVLYVIGTDAVKGFAVTLFVGIVMSMFTTLFVGRMIFDICERNRWIKSLNMLGPKSVFKFRFLSHTVPAVAASLILIGAGIAGMFARGEENFDIDFLGGTSVIFSFDGEAPPFEDIQKAVADQFKVSYTIEELVTDENKLFRLRTTDDDLEHVSQQITDAFEGSSTPLLRQNLEFASDLTPIPDEATEDEFAGGHQRSVTVSQPLAVTTLEGSVVETLGSIEFSEAADPEIVGAMKYSDPISLIEVVATDDSEMTEHSAFEVRLAPGVSADDAAEMFARLEAQLEKDPIYEETTQFKAAVAQDVMTSAILAILFSLVAIIAYLWFRFQGYTFGVAAVVALVHDVLAVLGVMALCSLISGNSFSRLLLFDDFKINLPIVAAVLTIIGYSLNDTIVVFDRIREIRGRNPKLTQEMIDNSLNQTLSRTILTALTTLIVVAILYIWGGEGIHGFAFSLMVGIFVGTYSSIYIASPVLLWLINRKQGPSTSSTSERRPVATT